MIRGITLKIPNSYGHHIFDVLQGFNIEKYEWYIGDREIYKLQNDVFTGESLFLEDFYIGKDFKDIIKNKKYCTIFLEATAYPKGSMVKDINTYDDFINSECEFILLIADNVFVSIYCKDRNIIYELYDHYIIKEYDEVELIDENDHRTVMKVF